MVTTAPTKSNTKSRTKKPRSRKPVAAEPIPATTVSGRSPTGSAETAEPIEHNMLHPSLLTDHPANPPERVSPPELDDLLRSIEEFGQREPVRVRPFAAGYQILSGHRRVAACRLIDREVRCEVVRCGNDEALRHVMLANADRKDLDPIQRAELMQTMIAAGIHRDEAGRMFGCTSESGIKNNLRLLKLPESIRKLITNGTIPARAARYLIPYADATIVLDGLAKHFAMDPWSLQEFVATPDSFEVLNLDTPQADARPMEGEYQPSWQYEKIERKFEPTPAQLKKLQIATVTHDGRQLQIALNVKLFDELQKPHLVKKSAYGSAKKKYIANSAKDKKLTPKQQAAEDKAKAKAAAEQLKKRLPLWRKRFERMALAIQTPAGSPAIYCTLPWWINRANPCVPWIIAAMESLGCKEGTKRMQPDLVSLLIGATDGTGLDVLDRVWRVLVWPQRLSTWPIGPIVDSERITAEPPKTLPVGVEWGISAEDINSQLQLGGVDLAKAWQAATVPGPEQMMLAEYLNLHSSAQLDTVAKAWKVTLADGATKKAKTKAILAAHTTENPLPMPKVLQQ